MNPTEPAEIIARNLTGTRHERWTETMRLFDALYGAGYRIVHRDNMPDAPDSVPGSPETPVEPETTPEPHPNPPFPVTVTENPEDPRWITLTSGPAIVVVPRDDMRDPAKTSEAIARLERLTWPAPRPGTHESDLPGHLRNSGPCTVWTYPGADYWDDYDAAVAWSRAGCQEDMNT
jgi:hypothetical protein